MTPSSTPGSPVPDDADGPAPWAGTGSSPDPGRGAGDDATRPLPPVSRLPRGGDRDAAGRTGAEPGAADHGTADHGTADSGADEDWSWYDDDEQHTRPLPPVSARVRDEDTAPVPPVHGGGSAQDTAVHAAAPYAVPAGAPAAASFPAPGPQAAGPSAGPGAGEQWRPGEPDPAARLARQREEFGGMQLVPGFFGWLSALALTWLLLALAGLAAAALGLRLQEGMGGVVDELAAGSPAAWTAAAALGAVELLAFVGGGYAAGRMARFSGARQGVSVWLWSLLGRSAATVAGLVWADTIGLAPVGVSAQALIGELLVPGLLAVVAVLAVDLLGAVLGGLWGTRYHRRVDRWGDTVR
ncbi:hypothetical protein ACSNO4_13050 [Kocuria flava]|uniref:hypothetical protein n=1 Tax=Kocuria flava TaxID=446860 RepID=UPI003F19EC7A